MKKIYGNIDDKYSLFTLPKGHVVYVVGLGENKLYDWHEEHINQSEIHMGVNYNEIIIYTEEGHKYVLEVEAFMTIQGAMSGCEKQEISFARMIERSKTKK